MPENWWVELAGPHGGYYGLALIATGAVTLYLWERKRHEATRVRLDKIVDQQSDWLKDQLEHQREVKEYIFRQEGRTGD